MNFNDLVAMSLEHEWALDVRVSSRKEISMTHPTVSTASTSPTPSKSIRNVCICAALLSLVVAGQPGTAATFNIADGDVAGLIAALNTANGNGQANTINLAAGATYTLTAAVLPDMAGLPRITSQMTINGNGATIARSAAPGTPLFQIFVVYYGNLTLNDLTVTGGATDSAGFGGGVDNNTGITTIVRSTISGNQAGNGGGIFNFNGTLIVINSTISGNKTTNGGYGGGGILNMASFG